VPRPAKDAPSKRDAILDAGWEVLLRRGYGRASMDEIAAEAGVSKRTVYDHFASKERLFVAIVERRRDEMLGAVDDAVLDVRDPERALGDFAAAHLSMSMSRPVLELYRVVLAEAPRLAAPARIMGEVGLDRVIERLAGYLQKLMQTGVLRREDSVRTAEALIGLVAGIPTTRGLMRLPAPRTPRELDAHARFAVALFLRGMSTADGASATRSSRRRRKEPR
jgi:TetR/AcrR family transcriptional regulator, mexJK operon transcriptional repressor